MSAIDGSPFVGRGAELAALAERFATGAWVTLLGPGGMGKTRLAARFAHDARAAGREVRFIELGASHDLSHALARIAHAVGVDPGIALDDVSTAIATRIERLGPLLLVLDDAERIAGELAPHVARWAASARILVTSRRVLGGGGEQVLPLEPLAREDAIALFVSRAHAVRPSARIDEEVAAAIVDAIDRMPLAIELAASRMRVLSLRELRGRLEAPLAVLRSSGDGRHASIRRAVTDSLELLSEPERRLFALAATLRDGFTVEDAEAALAGVFGPEAILDGIDALVRTSLLRALVDDRDRARYAYFATVREVAAEIEDAGRDDVLLRASRHFARLERAPVEAELENLVLAHRTAAALAVSTRSAELARDALALLSRIDAWLSASGRSALREALSDATLFALEATGEPSRDRARVRLGRGLARRELGRTAAAREDFACAHDLAEADDGLRAVALVRLAALDDVASDTAGARARLEEALKLLEATTDHDRSAREAEALLHLGHAYRREGQLDDARRVLAGAIERYRALGDDSELAAALYERSVVEIFARRSEASDLVDEGLRVARRAGARRMEGTLAMARGCLLHERGELGAARAQHAEAAQLFADLGDRHREASALFYLATTYVEARRVDDALALLSRARAHAAEVGAPRYEALIGACTATALALAGRSPDAKSALEAAARGAALVPHEPALRTTLAVHGRLVDVLAGTHDAAEALAASEREVAESSNDDSRFALRTLRSVASGVRPAPADVLEVARDGSSFRAPGAEERVTLPERSPLRRLLVRLVDERLQAPGRVVSIEELLGAAWPDEKMRADAGLNRLYVAIATLRKRGLGDVIVRAGGGYLVSPAVMVDTRD